MLLEQVNGIHLFLKVLSTNFKKDHLEILFNRLANNHKVSKEFLVLL